MITTWTNLEFVLALDSKILFGANTMFKKLRMSNVVVLHFISEGIDQRIVFFAFSTSSTVLALQGAGGVFGIVKFTARSTTG